jgi:hypothetical protein
MEERLRWRGRTKRNKKAKDRAPSVAFIIFMCPITPSCSPRASAAATSCRSHSCCLAWSSTCLALRSCAWMWAVGEGSGVGCASMWGVEEGSGIRWG